MLPSDIVNTLDFDGSDNNAEGEREQDLLRMICGQGSAQSPSIPPQHPQRTHTAFYGRRWSDNIVTPPIIQPPDNFTHPPLGQGQQQQR